LLFLRVSTDLGERERRNFTFFLCDYRGGGGGCNGLLKTKNDDLKNIFSSKLKKKGLAQQTGNDVTDKDP
jgi:hypothetical protein